MKAVICGAGVAGLAVAGRLAATGCDVVVVERSPGPREQGYMIDFFDTGYEAAEAMGLLPALREVAYSIEEATLVDARGRRRAGVDYDQFARAVDGRLMSLLRPDLERVLREALPPEVDRRFGTGPVDVADTGDGVRVTLADGEVVDADVLVGADGIHSAVRRLVFGEESRFLRYLGFHTAAFLFDAPEIHAATRGRFCLTDTTGRQMGFYGLRDGRVAVYAVHRTSDPRLPDDIPAELRRIYGSLDWVVPDALDRCPPGEDIYYDQLAQVELPSWSKGRVVLLGDACYAVSLLAGQGASLAVAGAYVLAEQLRRAPSVAEAFAGYERLWRPVAEEKQRAGRAGARWFLPESRFQLAVRRAALRLARLPVADRFLAGAVVGKSSGVITTMRQAAAELPAVSRKAGER